LLTQVTGEIGLSYKLFDKRVKLVFSTKGPGHHFFGYYDKSPLDATRRRLLCLKTDFNDRLPDDNDVAEIGYWDIITGKYTRLAETRAFNWQQGCRLQWLGPNFDRYIIFNDRQKNRFVSVVLDIETGESDIIPFPVYSVHPNGQCAVSVDFERHYFPRRAYAYAGIVRPEKNSNILEGDGIFFVDFKSKEIRRIISTAEICKNNHLTSMEWGVNYLEHLMFNPSGERFLFLHRWELEDGGIYTRVYTSDCDGKDVRCVLDSGKATHHCWLGNDRMLFWGATSNSMSYLRKKRLFVKNIIKPLLPLYHYLVDNRSKLAQVMAGSSYLLIDDCAQGKVNRFHSDKLTFDGHPSWNPVNQCWLITDTYQNKDGFQKLILFDSGKGRRHDAGEFYIPPEFSDSPMRCDLHPRWDFSGSLVCIDSLHSGSRQMYLFDVSDVLEKGDVAEYE